MRIEAAILGGLLLVSGPAAAQPAEPMTCPAGPQTPPAGLEAWSGSVDTVGADRTGRQAGSVLSLGRTARIGLHPVEQVAFVIPPGKPGSPGSYAGLVRIEISTAGAYRIALGEGAWIDLVADGKRLASTGHSHGPACSGVRKMVDFVLSPGVYLVQLSASPAARLRLLMAPIP